MSLVEAGGELLLLLRLGAVDRWAGLSAPGCQAVRLLAAPKGEAGSHPKHWILIPGTLK